VRAVTFAARQGWLTLEIDAEDDAETAERGVARGA